MLCSCTMFVCGHVWSLCVEMPVQRRVGFKTNRIWESLEFIRTRAMFHPAGRVPTSIMAMAMTFCSLPSGPNIVAPDSDVGDLYVASEPQKEKKKKKNSQAGTKSSQDLNS